MYALIRACQSHSTASPSGWSSASQRRARRAQPASRPRPTERPRRWPWCGRCAAGSGRIRSAPAPSSSSSWTATTRRPSREYVGNSHSQRSGGTLTALGPRASASRNELDHGRRQGQRERPALAGLDLVPAKTAGNTSELLLRSGHTQPTPEPLAEPQLATARRGCGRGFTVSPSI